MKDRALRRLKFATLKLRHKNDFSIPTDKIGDPDYLSFHVKNLAKCSCWMCGNPRKFHGEKTLQEQIFDVKFSEQTRFNTIQAISDI
jgi:hypothetical protein